MRHLYALYILLWVQSPTSPFIDDAHHGFSNHLSACQTSPVEVAASLFNIAITSPQGFAVTMTSATNYNVNSTPSPNSNSLILQQFLHSPDSFNHTPVLSPFSVTLPVTLLGLLTPLMQARYFFCGGWPGVQALTEPVLDVDAIQRIDTQPKISTTRKNARKPNAINSVVQNSINDIGIYIYFK